MILRVNTNARDDQNGADDGMTRPAPLPAAPFGDLLKRYRHAAPTNDEMFDNGAVRPHWGPLLSALGDLSEADRASRAAKLDRRVRETGIAYDIFADPNRSAQRWSLDLTPVVLPGPEWRWIEAALVQRAQLFDHLLADFYGRQETLRSGLVPAELVFHDPSFIRPAQGLEPKSGHLHFYAADLARGSDGRWVIIDSHTETLAGIGLALANRVVHTHVAGDLFNRCNAIRLAAHFQAIQAAITRHAGRDSARIALLTPGPHHEDYFSHAYLARYLGYLLVEGNDLRIKGDQVHLKTLEGLKPIDHIVRCIDGRQADPLELDPAGFAGPAGLMRAVREQPGLVTNAIGSAIVQNRGLGRYLPLLCRHYLGQDLMLEDAPRWWLGNKAARQHVLATLDNVLIRHAQEGTGRPGQAALGQVARGLGAEERDRLEREIALHGARLVAEETIRFSTAPALGPTGLTPRPFAMRLYVAKTADGFRAMPGGLAMTVDTERAVALSSPEGHTRDVWVVADTQQPPHVSLWRPTVETARVHRSQRVIQSRVADDLFWLGRYAERADWTMRVVRSSLRRVEEDAGPPTGRWAARKCLAVMLGADTAPTAPPAAAASATTGARQQGTTRGSEIERLSMALVARSDASRSLERTCEGIYRVAHLVRDRLSLEAWQTLSRFRPGDPWLRGIASATPVELMDMLEDGLQSVAAFNGLAHENMTRNHGWSFLDMGRRLERAYNLCEAIQALFVPVPGAEEEGSGLLLLLELADSFITYRSRYRLDPMLPLVLDLLLLDESNPRSLAYQLAAASRHLESLPDPKKGVSLADDRRLSLALLTAIQLADVEAIADESDRKTLSHLMQEQLRLLPELTNAISRHYFNLTDDGPMRVHTRIEPRLTVGIVPSGPAKAADTAAPAATAPSNTEAKPDQQDEAKPDQRDAAKSADGPESGGDGGGSTSGGSEVGP